jgi:hypothetical protein
LTRIPRRRRSSDARRNLGEEKRQEAETPIAGWLFVFNGKHKGEDFRIREGKNTVGSHPSCDVVLSDGHVSDKHASITLKREGPSSGLFRIVDLDSTNGTFHNDDAERISMEELVDNDMLCFGQTRCKFKCVG